MASAGVIHVVLVNAATQQLLGEVDLPAEQLPAAFDVATTLSLGGRDWQVEHAEPVTRAAYVATGRLRLVLREIERVDPKTILFSLPTLEDAMPPMQAGDGDAIRLHEDDWRQVELVAAAFEPAIAAELVEIRAVRAERQGPGYRRLHVRTRIPQPLAGTELDLGALGLGPRRMLGVGDAGVVAGGFAFDAGTGAIYGREEAGRVVVLGAWRASPDVLTAVARTHRLIVVDWCAATMTRPGA